MSDQVMESTGSDTSNDFEESKCELVKYVILQKETDDGDIEFSSIELHTTVGIPTVLQGQSIVKSQISPYKYRVFTHQGTLSDTIDEHSGVKKSYLAKTGPEALEIFQKQYDIWTSDPHNMTKTKLMLSRWLGSNVLTKRLLESQASKGEVSVEVARLADNLWKESMGELSEVLNIPVKSVPLGKVEKAESVLLQIKRAILDKNEKNESEIHGLSEQFYELIPHQAGFVQDLTNMKMVAVKQDLCQLIQDVINVNEALGWKKQPSAKSKYQAMRCYIEHLSPDHPEYDEVKDLVMSSTQPLDKDVSIQRIFAVNRALDEFKFDRTIGNERLLFHASKACNFLGILSRGILLPKIVVEMFGIDRWDAGMLGSGIYFGDAMSTCAKYSAPGKFTGTRFLAINNVALGNIKDIFVKRTDIEHAPEGFDSVHGVMKTDHVESFFSDDEYVVYQASQHCLRYLVEFKLVEKDSDENKSSLSSQVATTVDSSGDETDSDDDLDDEIDTLDVQGIMYPEAKVKAGLNTTVEGQVELEAVHVRASIIDLAAEVTVLQKYRNVGENTAETRYVFPLDERAAVCGFDAYINGKHVVGVVEEKGQARRSYNKAKQEGHGAYLMEEEAANVFSITVGNLPPGSCVVISVKYVTELVVEGDRIAFNLLGSVAPWKKKDILSANFDDKGDSVDGVIENLQSRSESFLARVMMPSRIRSVHCPTHSIKIQKKDEKVYNIAMCEGDRLVDGLQLLVDMEDSHKPRIWREHLPEDDERQACMVVFYPEFPVTTIENPEVVIMLDRSTSMKGQPMNDAKKLVHMILESLPSGSRYNLVVFGNDFEELFPTSVLATDENIKNTEAFLLGVTWERGATEVWRPLRAMSLLSSTDIHLTSNGFLISDGHVTNEQDTLMAVANNRQINRLFTFGVSSESNRHVLRTLADTGGGAYEQFDPRSKSTWEAKVYAQVRRSFQPAATSIKVNWMSAAMADTEPRPLTRKRIVQAPSQIASLFTGSRLVMYAMGPEVSKVELEAEIEGRTEYFTVSADQTPTSKGMTLHRLATRGIVRDWELGSVHANRLENDAMMDDVKMNLVKLGVEFNIVSPLTSFVAIEERDEGGVNLECDGPSLAEIMEDIWPSSEETDLPWSTQHASTGIETSCSMTQLNEILSRADGAQKSFSFVTAEHQYKQAMELAMRSFEPLHPAVKKAFLALAQFHLRVKGDIQLAHEVLSGYIDQNPSDTTDLDRRLTNMAKICKNLISKASQEEKRSSKTPPLLEAEQSKLLNVSCLPEPVEWVIEYEMAPVASERMEVEVEYAEVEPVEIVTIVKRFSPVMLEPEPVQLVTLEREIQSEEMHEIQYEAMSASSPVLVETRAEPLQSVAVEHEIQYEAMRAPSPVLVEAQAEPLQSVAVEHEIQYEAMRAPSPVLVEARAEPIRSVVVEHEIQYEAMRAPSPVLVEARAEPLQSVAVEHEIQYEAMRAPSPVLVEARAEPLRSVAVEYEIKYEAMRAPSPVLVEARAEPLQSVAMEHEIKYEAMRAPSPVLVEARAEPLQSVAMEHEIKYEAMRAPSPVLVEARAEPLQSVEVEHEIQYEVMRAPSPVLVEARGMMLEAQPVERIHEVRHLKMPLEDSVELDLELEPDSPSPAIMLQPFLEYPAPLTREAKQLPVAPAVAERIEHKAVRVQSPDMLERESHGIKMPEASHALLEPVETEPLISYSQRAESPVLMVHSLVRRVESVEAVDLEPQVVSLVNARKDHSMFMERKTAVRAVVEPVEESIKHDFSGKDKESEMVQRPDSSPIKLLEHEDLKKELDSGSIISPYKAHRQRLVTEMKEREFAVHQKPDDGTLEHKEDRQGVMNRLLKIADEDEAGWWTWDLTALENEFGVDCSILIDFLKHPMEKLNIEENLVDKWGSSLDVIWKIVAAALVMRIFEMWVDSLNYSVTLPASNEDNVAIFYIPKQVEGWLEHCLPSDVKQLQTLAFGNETTWPCILERFPSGVTEDALRPIRDVMMATVNPVEHHTSSASRNTEST